MPGRGRGYVVDGEAGLDWLFGGVADEEVAPAAPLEIMRPIFDATAADDGADPSSCIVAGTAAASGGGPDHG